MAKTEKSEVSKTEIDNVVLVVSKPTGKAMSAEQTKTYNGLSSKSAKIRFLNGLGWSRGEIAKFMQIRYQHVRNVLITPVKEQRA